jgi:hypothetical protein
MSLFSVIIVLVIVGVLLWLNNAYLPADANIKNILNVVAIIVLILWLLSALGVFDSQSSIHMGNFHLRW